MIIYICAVHEDEALEMCGASIVSDCESIAVARARLDHENNEKIFKIEITEMQ